MSLKMMTLRCMSIVLAVFISGCATPGPDVVGMDRAGQKFNIQAVYRECERLGCEEPNTVVASYFSGMVRQSGSACIIHIKPEDLYTPWRYWDDYLRPMQKLLAGSRVHLYAYVPAGRAGSGIEKKVQESLKQIEALYVRHGVDRGAITKRVTGEAATITPPYRDPYCHNRPLIEIVEGVRLVSPVASGEAEHAVAIKRAARTVLVVVETRHGR